MAAKRGATLRSQWLGKHLRELRETAGLTLKEAGDYLQRDASTVSRFEAGLYPARTPDVIALLDLYGIADTNRREGLIRLSREVWQNGWWDDYTDDMPVGIVHYAWLEARAKKISSYDAMVIPGLLQTRDYLEAVIRAEDTEAPDEQINRWIEFRVTRQKLLTTDAPELSIVLDEHVLRRAVGGPAAMRTQLTQLAKFASQPGIEIQVLPFTTGAHASPDGPFRIFELPEPYAAVAYAPTPAGAIYAEGEAAEKLKMKYDRIRRDALNAEESLDLITAIAEQTHRP